MLWKRLLIAQLLLLAVVAPAHGAGTFWTNPGTGAQAGDWFEATNWNPSSVPTNATDAAIDNGGEAAADVATTPPGHVVSDALDVGKNGGTGTLTVDGLDVIIDQNLDIGDVELGFATGSSMVTSMGTVTVRDAANFLVGGSQVGDLDIGQANAADTARAFGTGIVTLERVSLIDVEVDIDVGETGGTADATGDGTLIIRDAGTIRVGENMDVGETGSASGVKISRGHVEVDVANFLDVSGDLDVGRTFGTGGQDDGTGVLLINDVADIEVAANFSVGLSGVNNGGVALSDGTLMIERGNSLLVGSLLGVGYVRNTQGTGQATATGEATINDVDQITITTDLFVGRSFANDDVVGVGNGTLNLARANSVQINADLDVGETGAIGLGTGLGDVMGTGVATFTDIVGTMVVGGDADIGQTTAVANGTARGDGTLHVLRAGALQIGDDLNIGQATGDGSAVGLGVVTVRDTPMVTVADNVDVGQTASATNVPNQGDGTLIISDAVVDIGMADPALPGNLDIGTAEVSGSGQANGMGMVTFERSQVQVAGPIIVGRLSAGGTNPASSSSGTLSLVDSSVSAPSLSVATVLDSTAGTVSGLLQLNPSLVSVGGPVTLGDGATLEMGLGGTTRADGLGGPGQYSAIDAETATLAGTLQLNVTGGFVPQSGQTFQIVGTTSGVSGTFGQFDRPQSTGVGWAILYEPLDVLIMAGLLGDMDRDGDVDLDDVNPFTLALTDSAAYAATYGVPARVHGDMDQDGDQDLDDVDPFVAVLTGGAGGQVRSVPEPALASVLLTGLLLSLFCRPSRQVSR